MKAVVCEQGRLSVEALPTPVPGKGQVLLSVLRAGICGSDLHARLDPDTEADVLAAAGYTGFMRASDRVVFGHEFAGVVEDYGTGCRRRSPVGTLVTALPLRRAAGAIHPIGLSAHTPGAYAEQVVVEESLMMVAPNGLSPDVTALTEPLAVAWHAVSRAEISRRDTAVVIGCGPVGLATISVLRARGIKDIVASDPSPGRRDLARSMGAREVVDPTINDVFGGAAGKGALRIVPELASLGVGTMEKLTRLPVPWHHVFSLADRLGLGPKAPIVFECVGNPGMIDGLLGTAPLGTRIVVIGVCIAPDTIRPALAINKEIDLRFVLGYTPAEFRATLQALANGSLAVQGIVTGSVGLTGVDDAFSALAKPERHAKVLIDPSGDGRLLE